MYSYQLKHINSLKKSWKILYIDKEQAAFKSVFKFKLLYMFMSYNTLDVECLFHLREHLSNLALIFHNIFICYVTLYVKRLVVKDLISIKNDASTR